MPRPGSGAARPYRFPEVARLRTSSGIRIAVATTRRLPLVTVHVVVDGGAIRESPDQAGVALLTSRGLVEGTLEISADDVAERFELLGSSISPSADWESMQLQCTVLPAHVGEAFALLGQLVRAPAFRGSDMQRLRDERVADLLQRDTEPRELADDEFVFSLYQPGERLGLPIGGESKSISRLTKESTSIWHRAVVRPSQLSIVVVGDVSPAEIESIVGDELGGWASTSTTLPIPNAGRVRSERHVRVVEIEGAAQSELRIGHIGPPRRHPDYYALTVMNAILGGLFGSRINLNLRESHGYTYGASSGFSWRRDGSVFVLSTAVGTDVTVPAIEEINGELSRIREEAVAPAELSLAVDHLEGVFPLRFETTEALATALTLQGVYELPELYFDEYRSRIRAVTAEDVLRVAQQHLVPDHLHSVIVGNPSLRNAVESHFGSGIEVKTMSSVAAAE